MAICLKVLTGISVAFLGPLPSLVADSPGETAAEIERRLELEALEEIRNLETGEAVTVIRLISQRHYTLVNPDAKPVVDRLKEIRCSLPGVEEWYAGKLAEEMKSRR